MTPLHYCLQKVTPLDYPFLWQLNREVFKNYIEELWGWEDKKQQELFKRRMERDSDKSLIIVDHQPVGYLELIHMEQSLHIVNILLLPTHQGRGIGRTIIQDILLEASSADLHVRLQVFKINHRALKLYQDLKFTIIGESDTHWELQYTL